MDLRVWGNQDQAVVDRLADQHPIKGVAMVIGKLREVTKGVLLQGKG